MPPLTPSLAVAALLALLPYLVPAFSPSWTRARIQRLPPWAQLAAPALLVTPYLLVTVPLGVFAWNWCAVYALLPLALAVCAVAADRLGSRGWWLQLAVLLALGLSVDLRWLEHAWPPHLAIFNKVLLLDAGIYAFVVLRPLPGTGFDLRLRFRDFATGLREFLFYLPIGLALGLALGFLHTHPFDRNIAAIVPHFAFAWIFTFLFIAVPEELFFRGWLQNLLEQRLGRHPALAVTAILFGLAHFNKRTAFFNARYVLLAAIAGVFYGRAWRRDRRVAASAVTHATVDAVWSLWLR